ncbi:MAG: hypothetical protein DRR19_06845 [Candidatus Parabeggiatoa sp. nov. 1]|nr:MAG: hypothetical protein DRR19_06845 [Gammaproteobacteria bacterium]
MEYRHFFRVLGLSVLLHAAVNVGTMTDVQADEPIQSAPSPDAMPAPGETQTNPDATQTTPSVTPPPQVTPKVQRFFGEAVINILANPERVESFRVAYLKKSNTPLKKKVAGYPVLAQGPTLNDTQLKQFQSLVFSEKSYIFEADKRCMFFPDFGLRFVKGDKQVEILLSFYCDILLFAHEGKEKLEDCDPISKALGELRDALFPVKTTGAQF